MDEEKTAVIDHLNYDTQLDNGRHTTIVASPTNLIKADKIIGPRDAYKPILFRGVGMVSDSANPLTLDLLTAALFAYSFNPHNPVDEYPAAVGKSGVLVGLVQARNNARVVLTASLHMFSDAFLTANINKFGENKVEKCGNEKFVNALTEWVLKEKGVLRVKGVTHHKKGDKNPPDAYTITDQGVYSIEIEELQNKKWVPFEATTCRCSSLGLTHSLGFKSIKQKLFDATGDGVVTSVAQCEKSLAPNMEIEAKRAEKTAVKKGRKRKSSKVPTTCRTAKEPPKMKRKKNAGQKASKRKNGEDSTTAGSSQGVKMEGRKTGPKWKEVSIKTLMERS